MIPKINYVSDAEEGTSTISRSFLVLTRTLQVLGCLPDLRQPTNPTKVMLLLYSSTILLVNGSFLYLKFDSEPYPGYRDEFQSKAFNFKYHEDFYLNQACRANFIFLFVLQVLYWISANGILNHLEKWNDFEVLFFRITQQKLLPCRKRKVLKYFVVAFAVTFSLSLLQYDVFLNVQMEPYSAFFLISIFRCTDICFLLLMKATVKSGKTISDMYLDELQNSNYGGEKKYRLLQLEALWLKLADLFRGTGDAFAPVVYWLLIKYVIFGLVFSYLFWVRFLVLLGETSLRGLMGWLAEITCTYFLLWMYTTSASNAEKEMTDLKEKIRHTLNENESTNKIDEDIVDQITSFQEVIGVLPPKIELLNYLTVDKQLLLNIMQLNLTYLIVLIQFKIAEYNMKQQKELTTLQECISFLDECEDFNNYLM